MRQALALALLCVMVTVATDVMFRSSLSRALWPLVETPADGAAVSLPLTIRWAGPHELYVTLVGGDVREDLGLRQNPTEISAEHFPRPGQYRIELRSPVFGRWSATERRFLVRAPSTPHSQAAGEKGAAEEDGQIEDLTSAMDQVGRQHEITQAENASLYEENAGLRVENNDLARSLEDLRHLQMQTAGQLDAMEAQQGELKRQYDQALEENQRLRARIESIPECTNWGYVSYQRGARRVMVSDGRGEVFRDQLQCEATRRYDSSAVSPCICVGSPWQR
jgi:regulator of replication initiation timing